MSAEPSTIETWSPDTCNQPLCMVTIDYSTSPPTWVSTTQTCSAHTSLSGQALVNCLYSENVLKNNAVNQFPISYNSVTGSLLTAGTISFTMVGTAPNRTVSVSSTGAAVAPNAITISTIQTKLNSPVATVSVGAISATAV